MKKKGKFKVIYFEWMKDRYGVNDTLNKHLLFLSILLLIIYPLVNNLLFLILPLALLLMSYFRFYSKNKKQRQDETKKYQKLIDPFKFNWLKVKNRKEYVYLKCSNCGQKIRVPKNKGNIKVICPECQHEKVINT